MIEEKTLSIGDEFYKLRFGKDDRMSYYKIIIIDKILQNNNKYHYRYFIKGRSKKRDMYPLRLGTPQILAYKNSFYSSKLQMLIYLDSSYDSFTPQTRIEIDKAKKLYTEYFI